MSKAPSRKRGPAPPPLRKSASRPPLLGSVSRAAAALGVMVSVMCFVVWLGGQTGRVVAPRDRYKTDFATVQIPPPPTDDTLRFLTEVRYLADLPASIQTVDPNLEATLKAAFTKHPWVARVEAVTVTATGQIQVQLQYRTPTLAVAVQNDPAERLVDRSGVLLPGPIPNAGTLPTFITPQPAPRESPGEVWMNDLVKRATDLAATYRPRTIEKTTREWRLILPDGRTKAVLW